MVKSKSFVVNNAWVVFFRNVSFLGSLVVYLLFFFLLWFFDPSWFFLYLFLMLFLSTLFVYLIKWLFPTRRPDFSSRNHRKNLFFWQRVDMSSFPSAHAARAFGLFTISLFFNSLLLQVFSLSFWFLVSYSRIFLRRHYWKDIIGGSVIGFLSGVLAFFLAKFLVLIPWLNWLF